jgi:Flp pilus assembly protein TadG
VEFALIAPLLIMVMFGIISFGLLFSWRSVLNNAAREGARAGAVCKTDDEIRQIVSSNSALLPHADTIGITITVADSDGLPLPLGQTRQRGGVISVTVNYEADVLAIPGILSAARALTGRSTFRMECDAFAP